MTAQLEADSIASETRPAVSSWRSVGAILAIVLVVAALYWPTVRALTQQWEDLDGLTYTHGYLIALIGAWLIVRARPTSPANLNGGSARAAAALAAASFVWLLSYRAGIEIITQVLLPLIAWLAVLAVLGAGVARRCAFAFAYLYFAIPVWDFGNGILQYLTVYAVGVALTVAGIPAYVDDNLVHIPVGVFEIAGGCSGLHFFIVATAIAALYGEMNRDSVKSRVLLLALAAALSILSNWVRVFWIIAAGYYTDMQHPLVSVTHYYFGWKVFAAMMVVFFLIARLLPVAAESPPATAAPVSGRRMARWLPWVFAAAAVGPAWALLTSGTGSRDGQAFAFPAAIGGWSAERGVVSGWQPRFTGADYTDAAVFRAHGREVEVFTAIYFEQAQGRELVGFANSVGGALRTVADARLEQPAGAVHELQARATDGKSSLIWYYYEIGRWRTAQGMAEQVMYGLRSLAGAPPSRVVAVRAPCAADCSAARQDLEQFSAALDSALPPLL